MPCLPNFWRRLRSLFGVGNREGSEGDEIGEPLSPGLRRCLTVLADPPQILVNLAIVWILHLYAAELEEETDGAIGWTQESLESVPPVLLSRTRDELIRNYETLKQNILGGQLQDAPVPRKTLPYPETLVPSNRLKGSGEGCTDELDGGSVKN